MKTCRICAYRADLPEIIAREVLLGTQEEFSYFECLRCGTVQICRIPEDLSRYYPPQYYSLAPPRELLERYARPSPVKSWLASLVLHKSFPAKSLLFRGRLFPQFLREVSKLGLRQDSAILDVGCGEGLLLRRMYSWGFSRLTGTDPFLATPVQLPGLTLKKGTLEELQGSFDLVTLHHVIEHVGDPRKLLGTARKLLHESSWLLITTPLADSYGWRKYRANWLGLDPPRHLHVFTVRSITALAQEAGYRLVEVVYDPGELLWEASFRISLGERPFGPSQSSWARQRAWKRWGQKLALLGDADVATLYLRLKAKD